MEIKAYGKVNLTLMVEKKNKRNSMHKIKSVMLPYDKNYDVIKIEKNKTSQVTFKCNKKAIDPYYNTVMKSYYMFIGYFPQFQNVGLDITMQKNTTIGSGLGFSASDGVSTLNLLCKMFKVDVTHSLIKLAIKRLGSDAVFFIDSVPSYVTHYGEKVRPLSTNFQKIYFLDNKQIISPKIGSITKDVFEKLDSNYEYYRKNMEIIDNDYFNILQQPAFDINPPLFKKYHELKKQYDNVLLSGSGDAFIVWNKTVIEEGTLND